MPSRNNRNSEHSLQQPPLTPFEISGFYTSLTIEEDLWTIDGTDVVIFLEHEKWKSGNQYHAGGSNNRGLGHLMDIQWEEDLFAWQDQWFKWSSSSRSATDQIIPICFVTATLPWWTGLYYLCALDRSISEWEQVTSSETRITNSPERAKFNRYTKRNDNRGTKDN